MYDFLRRVIKNPPDYLGVLRFARVTLIRTEEHSPGVHSFIFEKPHHLTWKSGQHGVWWLGAPVASGNWRAFTVASSPNEGELRISTTIPDKPSTYKEQLLAIQPGEKIWLQGPFGEFHATGKTKLVGVAGGIGITPFRALAYDIAHGHAPGVSLRLIYAAPAVYTFQNELDTWAALSDGRLTLTYVRTPEEVNASLTTHIAADHTNTHFCLSGSPRMITSLSEQCHKQGVRQIVSDPFNGF